MKTLKIAILVTVLLITSIALGFPVLGPKTYAHPRDPEVKVIEFYVRNTTGYLVDGYCYIMTFTDSTGEAISRSPYEGCKEAYIFPGEISKQTVQLLLPSVPSSTKVELILTAQTEEGMTFIL